MELLFGVDVPLSLLLFVLLIVLLYLYGTWPYSQWKMMGINGPQPQAFLGNQLEIMKKGNTRVLTEWNKIYGRTYGIYQIRQPSLVTSDLDILKEVLVKDFGHFTDRYATISKLNPEPVQCSVFFAEGAAWKRIRAIITPTFSAGKLKMMEGGINKCAAVLVENLKKVVRSGGKLEVKEYCGAFTLDIITRTAFGIQVNTQSDLNEPFVTNLKTLTQGTAGRSLLLGVFFIFPFLMPILSLLSNYMLPLPMKNFIESIDKMIELRKQLKEGERPVDFLQLLINAEHEQGTGTDGPTLAANKRLSKVEVVGQAFMFLFAGYETTSTTLQYLSYSLARHPDVQDRILQEIRQKLGDEEPTYDNVGKLKYLEHAILETLRLYPPVTMATRKASETVTIKGVTIPKGFSVLIPVFVALRDPEYFPDPDKFIPERWESANKNDISYLAFGFGPRQCIGTRLAWLVIRMGMVHVLRAVKFNPTDLPEKITFKPQSGPGLPSDVPLLIEAELRQSTS